jgi:hypothetical protein
MKAVELKEQQPALNKGKAMEVATQTKNKRSSRDSPHTTLVISTAKQLSFRECLGDK